MARKKEYGLKLELTGTMLRDERFTCLGELTGRGKFDARGRYEQLCYDCLEKTQDVRTADEIDHLCGWFDRERGRFADLMVKADLAEQVPAAAEQNDDEAKQMLGGYRIKGVKDAMEWLVELRRKRAESASVGGKKSAEKAKRGAGGQFEPQNTEQMLGEQPSKIKQNPGGSGTVPVSGSGSRTGAQENLFPDAHESAPESPPGDPPPKTPSGKPPRPKAKTADVWEAYCEAYQARWHVTPADGRQVRSQMKSFIEKVGAEDAPKIVQFYLTHNRALYVEKCHDFGLCLMDAVKLRTEWLNGRQVTRQEAQTVERKQATMNVFAKRIQAAEARERGDR